MPIFGYLTDRLQPLFVLVPALALITALFCLAGIVSEPFQVGGILSLEYVAAAAAYSSALAVIGKLAPNALPLIGIGQSLAMSVGSLMAGIIIETNGVPHVFVFYVFLPGSSWADTYISKKISCWGLRVNRTLVK